MQPKAIIFGYTGQDGGYMCRSLLDKKYEVYGISRKNKPDNHRLAQLGIENKISQICCDLENYAQTKNTINQINPQEIYNLSAQSSVGDSFSKPLETQKSIVNSTVNILETCRDLDFRGKIFFAGSSEIFEETDQPIQLSSNIKLGSPYATAKYQSYILTKMYRKLYGLKCVTGILFNHESPLRDKRFVIKKIVSTAVKIKKGYAKKLVLGDLSIKRDWGYAKEYVEAIQMMTRSELTRDYIICTGKCYSLKDIVKRVFEGLDLDWTDYVETSNKFMRASETSKSVGNPDLIYKDLGWKSKTTIDELIKILIDNELEENKI